MPPYRNLGIPLHASWYPPNVMKSATALMVSPHCTEHPPLYCKMPPHGNHGIPPHASWYPSTRLKISRRRTPDASPQQSWYPSTRIMVSPQCTEYPPPHSWYPPTVLNIRHRTARCLPTAIMVSPQCTEHPPPYCTTPTVLHTHYMGWERLTITAVDIDTDKTARLKMELIRPDLIGTELLFTFKTISHWADIHKHGNYGYRPNLT